MLALAILLTKPTLPVTAADDLGAVIYREQCASCHGADGQGTPDAYKSPLAGEHSIAALTRLIDRTMPEGAPEECVGAEARAVAEYIHREFYSLPARERRGLSVAPRVELTRLTVPQFRNAVADLLLRFTPPPQQPLAQPSPTGSNTAASAAATAVGEPGLRAEYFQSKGMSKADQRRLERVDRRLEFDFGTEGPTTDIAADQFSIIWEGSLVTAHTGDHEFRIRTPNGARLYLNFDNSERLGKLRDDSSAAGQTALIDAWVSSGEMREETARTFLLGGRTYPLRLEFFKYKEPNASVVLEWKPPHGTWTVLDHHHLTTAGSSRTFVIDTPFPADDRSLGYERGRSVSPEWFAAVNRAAIATAAEVVDRLPLLSGVKDDAPDRAAQLQNFVIRLATAAYRRPLTDAERQMFGEKIFAASPNVDTAVRRSVLMIVASPEFLYNDLTPANGVPTQHAVADRLAWALWDSVPDAELAAAADSGQLATAREVERQAIRMMADPRARSKIAEFFQQWLDLEERDVAKDRQLFPQFDDQASADLRQSLEMFVDRVFWSEASDYRKLLLADSMWLNESLNRLYGTGPLTDLPRLTKRVPVPTSDPPVPADVTPAPPPPAGPAEGLLVDAGPDPRAFVEVRFPSHERAGVLAHPYLLSMLAYHNNTSPIHRGVFLTRKVVGRSLKPPPIAVAFKNDEFAPDLTMREKITQLTQDKACMGCHALINPLGFALEHYDPIGRWRTTDQDKPVNTVSTYVTVEGQKLNVTSARDIADYAVTSESAHRSFVHHLFHHLVKQDTAAFGADTAETLRLEFESQGFNMQRLAVRMAVLAARQGAAEPAPPEPAPPEPNSPETSPPESVVQE